MNFTKLTIPMLIGAVMLTSCATTTSTMRFYTLANNSVLTKPTTSLATAAPIAIEILPVKVPERLKRPQLVINTKNSSQLKILEQDRWSSSFNDELQDAFTSGISSKLNAIDISHGGRIVNQPTYRIAIVLLQFNATPGEKVNAHFGWTVTRLDLGTRVSEQRTLSCQANISTAVESNTDAIVRAVREAVSGVILAISTNVSALNQGKDAKCSEPGI